MDSAFLSPDDERWSAWVDANVCDIYHRPEYARASASHEDGTPAAFFAEDKYGALLIPLLIREIPGCDSVDVASPYGYPAPTWTARDPAAHFQAFLRALSERGVVSAFLRLHPLLPALDPLHLRSDAQAGFGEIVTHGPTVWSDRTGDNNTIGEGTRSDHRSDIRRLIRMGYTVEIHSANNSDAMNAFRSVYHVTMKRVGASSFYDFSDAYFNAWQGPLSSFCDIVLVRGPEGDVAAAGLFTRHHRWMQFHLSGTASAHRKYAPTKLMLHRVRSDVWTRQHRSEDRGTRPWTDSPRVLHLGGGLEAEEDSLFHFKAGFSQQRAVFKTCRLVCDPATYADLTLERVDLPPDADPSREGVSSGFFPAYRK